MRRVDLAKPRSASAAVSVRETSRSDQPHVSPEFRNRLDATISFSALSTETIGRVVDKFLLQLKEQLAIAASHWLRECPRQWLAEKGYDPLFGARLLARVIQEHIKKPLADELLFGRLSKAGSSGHEKRMRTRLSSHTKSARRAKCRRSRSWSSNHSPAVDPPGSSATGKEARSASMDHVVIARTSGRMTRSRGSGARHHEERIALLQSIHPGGLVTATSRWIERGQGPIRSHATATASSHWSPLRLGKSGASIANEMALKVEVIVDGGMHAEEGWGIE